MITHVKFISIPVRDQEHALKFYTEKLGFKIATNQEMGGGSAGLNCASGPRRRAWCCSQWMERKAGSAAK